MIKRKIMLEESDDLTPKPRGNNSKIPKAAYFIISNEVCERFSFYGLKAILALYLNKQLQFSEDAATSLVHAFIMVAYAMTLPGIDLCASLFSNNLTSSRQAAFWPIHILANSKLFFIYP